MTPRLVFGSRFLSFALLIAVLPMGLSGAALRSAFLLIALPAAILGLFQTSLMRAMKGTVFFIASGEPETVRLKLKQGKASIWPEGTEAFSDWLIAFVYGGRYWSAIAFGAFLVFMFSSQRIITATAGVALLWAMRLLYRAISEPFSPKFFGDSLEELKKKHFIIKEPPASGPPAIGEPPPTTDDKPD
jgi:hypothetical protein